jgi:putative transposase
MTRPLRVEYPGALYHVLSRGNAKQGIFEDDRDRQAFLLILDATVSRLHWICHAYCLMQNHYHLMVETPDANLSRGMRQLNGVYAQAFNRRHGRVGHLLQGRFSAKLVDRDNYFLELARYLVLNPVRSGHVDGPSGWRWSNYRATAGLANGPSFLETGFTLRMFADDVRSAVESYRRFVLEGMLADTHIPADSALVVGDRGYAQQLEEALLGSRDELEFARRERYAGRPPLAELMVCISNKRERNERILDAYGIHGYKGKEIADQLGLHYSTISRIVNDSSRKVPNRD